MGIAYNQICRWVALRAKQLSGGDTADVEAAYASTTVEGSLDGVEVPYSALKQDVLAVEAELVELICASNNPIYKRAFAARSSAVPNGEPVPLVDERGWRFIGAYDSILDNSSGFALTEQPIRIVQRFLDDQAQDTPFFKIQPFHYAFQGEIIIHTTDAVRFRGCSWDYGTQSALFDITDHPVGTDTFVEANVNISTDRITLTSHNYVTGIPVRLSTDGTLPSPLSTGQIYYLIVINANTVELASSQADAFAGIGIDLTTDGSTGATHTVTPVEDAGGGQSPLPQALQELWGCKILAQLPQEDWFIPEASYYRSLANEKTNEVIEGRIRMLSMPSMPDAAARVAAVKD